MKQDIKETLQKNGIQVEKTLQRFMGKEELYERILLKFKEDLTFERYQKAAEKKDWEEVFRELHTLKGVASNLGMEVLTEKTAVAVEKLRENNLQGIEEDLKEIEKAYKDVMCIIQVI